MAKKSRKTLDQYLHHYLQFEDDTEFVIFMVWALFVTAFLVEIIK